jgi:hypothetical protein
MSFPKWINFVIKLWLSDLSYHAFRIGRFLILSPSPLRWGKVGMGVDVARLPPHLNPPPPRGEEVIFLTQLGSKLKEKILVFELRS